MPKRITILLLSLLFCAFNAGADDMNIITAEGFGTVDSSRFSKPQARLLARRAAIVEAQRNLVEVIDGVRITSGTTVKDMMLESDIIGTRVKGMVRGAFIVSESLTEEDGSWIAEVKLAVCINGGPAECKRQPTLASLVQPELTKPAAEDRFEPETAPLAESDPAIEAELPSGLIIDVSNQNFAPMLDVRVRTDDGKEVYGPGHVANGSDWLHWANSIANAGKMVDILGEKPLVVNATGIGAEDDVLISRDVAERIYQQNQAANDFLKQGKVVFVVK